MILKNPSWQTLDPGLPEYITLDSESAIRFMRAVGLVGKAYQVSFEGKTTDFYMVETAEKQQKFFVKSIKEAHAEHHCKAEEIAQWLEGKKIRVNAALKSRSNNYYVYPLLEGRRLASTPTELKKLAISLASLHQVLKECKEAEAIKLRTEKRIGQLNEIREQVACGEIILGPCPAAFKELAQNRDLNFTSGHNIQILHGDLNPGNLLCVNEEIYFFDFEDTLHSYLPVVYELAYVLERLVMTRHSDVETMIDIGRSFIIAYLEHGGYYDFHEHDSKALLTLALRSLCILALSEMKGNKMAESEWYKFFNLASLANKNQSILKKILKA